MSAILEELCEGLCCVFSAWAWRLHIFNRQSELKTGDIRYISAWSFTREGASSITLHYWNCRIQRFGWYLTHAIAMQL